MRRMTEGQMLAAETEMSLRDFLYWPTSHHYVCGTLWLASASLRNEKGEFMPFSTGRPLFVSNDADTGKSLSTKVMCDLCVNGKVIINPTSHGLASGISVNRQVPGIEEVDKKLGLRGIRNQDMMAIILGGYQKGATIQRERSDQPEDVHIHGPMILNGNNASMIMHSKGYEPFRTRSHLFLLEKPPEGHELIDYDPEIHQDRLHAIRDRWSKWGRANWRDITSIDVRHIIDPRIKTRQKEIWTILFRVAEFLGGKWPELCLKAAKAMVLGIYDDELPAITPADELLIWCRSVFQEEETFLPTRELIHRLMTLPKDRWWQREWKNPKAASMGLSRMLGLFEIEKERQTYKGEQVWGYALDNLDNLDPEDNLDNLGSDEEPEDETNPENWDWSEVDI